MNTTKRKIFLIIIATISMLSTYQFIDVYSRFKFLLADIKNNLTEGVIVFMIIVLLLSITSYIAIFFNWKLLRNVNSISNNNLIDESENIKQTELGFSYFGYLAFSGLVVGLGMFLIIETIKDYYTFEDLPNGLLPYFVAIIIIGLGVALINDGIKIKRTITVP